MGKMGQVEIEVVSVVKMSPRPLPVAERVGSMIPLVAALSHENAFAGVSPLPPEPPRLHCATAPWLKLPAGPLAPAHNGGPACQVGAARDTEGILFGGFRLHKHHYHLADLESLLCSAATPILSAGEP